MSYYDFQVTPRYVQCEHALREIRRYTYGLGNKILVLTACGPITDDVTATIQKSYASSMESQLMPEISGNNHRYNRQINEAKRFDAENKPLCDVSFLDVDSHEVCDKEIEKLVAHVGSNGFDVVIGVGGGRALDFTRATAFHTGINSVLVPTSPSTNAAATPLFITHSEDGKTQTGCTFLANYPSLVLVDLSIMIRTPPKLLAAGIADQLCSYYECLYSAKRLGKREAHSYLTWAIVADSVQILREHAKEAYEANAAHKITRAYESLLSMVLHNNGLARAVSGSGFAHLCANALVKHDVVRTTQLHGMQVGYAVIPMMVAEGEKEADIAAYVDYCVGLGIPVTLEQLGIGDISEETLRDICRKTCVAPSAEVPFTGDCMADCILKAEGIVKAHLEGRNDG